jgi:mRNA turnover protein 4
VTDWFADFHPPDFARAGNIAARTVALPAGPVLQRHSDPPEPFPHNEEPQLRKLGLHTSMNRGVPTLAAPQTVCEKGKKLTPEQARLLKLLGERMIEFRVLRAWWSADTGELMEVEGLAAAVDDAASEGEDDEDGDEEEV